MKHKLEQVTRDDGRYTPEAAKFIYDGLAYTIRNLSDEPKHVTGQMLCEGLRQLAIEKWGLLALLVLDKWGVRTTRDFGEIVYLLIDHNLMSAQPTDSIDHFDNVYDFKTTFKDKFQF